MAEMGETCGGNNPHIPHPYYRYFQSSFLSCLDAWPSKAVYEWSESALR